MTGHATSRQAGLGARVRDARVSKGLSQHALAGDGVSASYVSLIESGKRTPTPRALAVLAGRLGVDSRWLLTGQDASASLAARTDLAFARVALHEGRHEQARDLLTALDARGAPGDLEWEVRFELATAHERLGELRDAIGLLEALRTQAEAAPERLPWLPLVVALSRCYREAGDTSHAIALGEAALARCDRLGLDGLDGHPALVSTLAGLYAERGDLHRAGAVLDALIERTDSSRGPRERAYAYWNAAINAAELGEPREALRLVERAAALLADSDDDRNVARLRVSRAWVLLAQEPPGAQEARALLEQALPSLRQHAGAVSVAAAQVELGRAEMLLGRPDEASACALEALGALGDEHALVKARAHAVLGAARTHQGRRDEGRSELAAAAALLDGAGAARQAAVTWRQLAEAYAASGDAAFALDAARRALDAVGVVAQPVTLVEAPVAAEARPSRGRSAART